MSLPRSLGSVYGNLDRVPKCLDNVSRFWNCHYWWMENFKKYWWGTSDRAMHAQVWEQGPHSHDQKLICLQPSSMTIGIQWMQSGKTTVQLKIMKKIKYISWRIIPLSPCCDNILSGYLFLIFWPIHTIHHKLWVISVSVRVFRVPPTLKLWWVLSPLNNPIETNKLYVLTMFIIRVLLWHHHVHSFYMMSLSACAGSLRLERRWPTKRKGFREGIL